MRDEITLVPSFSINRDKWNHCVNACSNALVYATSPWLDHLADNWSGLVLNDYDAVMPVAWRKKWGIHYSYHVPFIQQLGIYSLSGNTVPARFTKALFSFCRYGSYPFNFSNEVSGADAHTNFVLSLDGSYEQIAKGFSTDVLQNIKRAENAGLLYQDGDIDEAVDVFRELYSERFGEFEEPFQRLWKLCGYLSESGNLVVRSVRKPNGELLAAALLPKDGRRVYNILNSTSPEGKRVEANYFLLSQIWKEFERSGLLFDFEGSDIPGVREFYRKFGAVNQPYLRLGFNRLPWPIKFLKK